MRPLRIAMIGHVGNSVLVRGGLEVHLDAMVSALRCRGLEVSHGVNERGGTPDVFQFVGAFYGLGGAFDAARGVPRVVMPILLHAGRPPPGWRFALDLGRGLLKGSLLAARQRMLSEADLVITNSQFEASEAGQWGARHVEVVPAGVDLERFRPAVGTPEGLAGEWAQRVRGLDDHRPLVVTIGRFERRKNQREVALACRRLGARLVCIGRRSPMEPGWLDELRRTAIGVEVWEDAPFDVVRWALTKAQVHALATEHETAGLVSLEAAACGARPVAVDQPTAREYLLPFGVLARSAGPEDLARAIESALLRGRLAERDRASLRRFGWDVIAESLETAYRRHLPVGRAR